MSRHISNLKLGTFFDKIALNNKKLNKKASVGHFNDIITEEDVAKNAKMISEMLQLPKYQNIKTKLQNSSGIVNFITSGEYTPLVELLVKHCFPPNNNDIYNMGKQALPDDYFVDAKTYFGGVNGGIQGDPQANQLAGYKLSELLLGSRKKMSTEWAKEIGMNLSELDDYFSSGADTAEFGGDDEPQGISQQILAYEESLKKLNNLKSKINDLNKKIRTNDQAERPASPLKIKEMVLQFKRLRGLYSSLKNQIDTAGMALIIPDGFSGEAERNTDGFIQYDPLKEIRAVGSELIKSIMQGSDEPIIASNINNLREKIKEYRTSDPILMKKRNEVLSFLGNGDSDEKASVNRVIANFGLFGKIQHEFNERVNGHGKVILLKNFENSVLCTPPTKGETNSTLRDAGVLKEFSAANTSNLTRDRSTNKTLPSGKRTLVVISEQPIDGLPSNTKINLSDFPVDAAEADIIVRNILEQYESKSKTVAELKMFSDIDEKYEDLMTGMKSQKERIPVSNKKELEVRSVPLLLQKMENLGSVTSDVESQMARIIQGMGQKEAINCVLNSLASSTVFEEDDRGRLISFGIDAKSVLGNLTTEFNESSTENTLGLGVRPSKVEFDNYVYKGVSEWGSRVGDVGSISREMARLKEIIKRSYQEIREIDAQLLDRALSPEIKNELAENKEGWRNQIQAVQGEKIDLMAQLPHYTILWGKPGVGKSVWADALGSLLGYAIRNVNIGQTKDKWLGNTEKYTKELIDKIFNARDTIFLMDEIDRMLSMGHGSQGGSAGSNQHETTTETVKQFLDAFEDRKTELIDNNIFIIMTTNHLEDIDTALLERSQGNVFEVESADTKEDYLKFLTSFIQTEYNKDPMHPWFKKPGDITNEQKWKSTFELIDSLDMDALATALEGKSLSFRNVEGMVKQAFGHHRNYLVSLNAIGRGDTKVLRGLPLTTENLISAVQFAKDASASNADYDLGIDTVKLNVLKEAQKVLDEVEMNKVGVENPFTKEVTSELQLPDEVVKIMNGSIPIEETAPQFNVLEQDVEDSETGEIRKQLMIEEQQGKSMNELMDEGFVEEELAPQKTPKGKKPQAKPTTPQSQPTQTEEEEEEKDETITSNSDYLYNFLKRGGFITPDNKIISAQNQQKQVGNQQRKEEIVNQEFNYQQYNDPQNLEKRGVIYFGGVGGGFIAPNSF